MEGCCCMACVQTQSVGIVEGCGKFDRLAPAGLTCLIPGYQSIVGRVSLRVRQLDVPCETKT